MDQEKLLLRLAKFQRDIEAGRIVLPTALGPGTLKKNSIKAKSITSTMIDVNDLNSVNANTGDLNITGNLTMSTDGAIRAGKTGYSDTVNSGYWLGVDSAVPKFRIGSSSQSLLWDGTNLTITGSITATTGTIGGWTIGSTSLTADAGATGMASSGTYRFWTGDSTPANAEFYVTSLGYLKSTSGNIGGWDIDALGIRLGSGATQRGLDSGSTAFYAGSATPGSAPFRVTTAGAVTMTNATISGTITASTINSTNTINASGITTGTLAFGNGGTVNSTGSYSGTLGSMNLGTLTVTGTITLGSGGKIIDADGSQWDQNGITLVSGGSLGDTIKWVTSGPSNAGSVYADSTQFIVKRYSGSSVVMDTSDQVSFWNNAGGVILLDTISSLSTTGRMYPGNQSTRQSTYYIDAGSSSAIITNGIGIGGMLGISSGNTINFISPGTGGSASSWSSFTSANIPDKSAGYLLIQIAGTNYRVPFYANS